MINLYVGYDPRESVAYHVFCQSVMDKASVPVRFTPLHVPMLSGFDGQRDGTNAFIFSRYLIPYLQEFRGWALFCDGDMLLREDVGRLWELRDPDKAVQVVQHDYQTRHPRKYVGSPIENSNVDYPMKNASSVVIWNCAHPSNRILSREFVEDAGGAFLHRFQWLRPDEIGALPPEWNHLVMEYPERPDARLAHFTLGVPGFNHYQDCEYSSEWNRTLLSAFHLTGETVSDVVRRAFQKA